MKIFVTGNAGSGKSTLAKQIADQKCMDFYSLDRIVWMEHWQKRPKQEQKYEIAKLIKKDSWVIDGVDYEILRAADLVIFLDVPRRTCYYRAAKRNTRYLFSSRPDLPKNCPEILIIPQLIKIIWHFPNRVKPNILLEKHNRDDGSVIQITNASQLNDYLLKL